MATVAVQCSDWHLRKCGVRLNEVVGVHHSQAKRPSDGRSTPSETCIACHWYSDAG